jgi:hypothetical protein
VRSVICILSSITLSSATTAFPHNLSIGDLQMVDQRKIAPIKLTENYSRP